MNMRNLSAKRLSVIVLAAIGIFAFLFITCNSSLNIFTHQIVELKKWANAAQLENCPPTPPNRIGRIPIDFEEESLEIVESRLSLSLPPGGWFILKECKANHRVAVVVAKREREYMLPIFLKNIHSMLMKQQLEYGIYVVEQTLDQDFNRGAVFNIAFKEALKMKQWDCFIYHDIDMIPFDDRNIYNCPPESGPRHMAVGVDKFGYKLLRESYYGGIIAYTTAQYKKINGMTNLFWNWGGEDDDLYKRSKNAGFNVTRPSADIAMYKSLPHRKASKMNQNWKKQLKESDKYFNVSGLNSLKYHIKEFKIKPTHVHIFIDHIENR